jgi:hypothetical protein
MPRPPILPTLDWPAIFAAGLPYEQWIAAADPAQRERIEQGRRSLALEPPLEAWLGALARPVHVAAIAEDWCGDVVRHVPVLQLLADHAPQLRVRYLSREQSREAFARFLVNGGEAIPVFVFLNDSFVECGHWGPMSAAGKEWIARGKACGDLKGARERVAKLYEADPARRDVIGELVHLIDIAASTAL